MLTDEMFNRILDYFDKILWSGKTSETGWNYYGLILDWYFDNSILSIDYLGIEDYFSNTTGSSYSDTKFLAEQYANVNIDARIKIIKSILQILNNSTYNKAQSSNIIQTITNVLKRNHIKVIVNNDGIEIFADNYIDSGSFCNIYYFAEGVLIKKLKQEFANDVSLQKRIRYEFENMKKLSSCPYILKVYDYFEDENSYTMEQAETNLGDYLFKTENLTYQDKIKIITDILQGMKAAHEQSIIHRDIHLGNVLKIGADFVIADFGLSKDLSIERSLKSSTTQKNNHIFVDPLVINDFTKTDIKSDVYSIGKMIDYIMTFKAVSADHELKTVVERCICRDKSLRLESASEILAQVHETLKSKDADVQRQEIVERIRNSQYNINVQTYIVDLIDRGKLCTYIVANKLYNFGELLVQFELVYQEKILVSIHDGYAASTGYNGWANYDIYAKIAFHIYKCSQDTRIREISKIILAECAEFRYDAKNMFDSLID